MREKGTVSGVGERGKGGGRKRDTEGGRHRAMIEGGSEIAGEE